MQQRVDNLEKQVIQQQESRKGVQLPMSFTRSTLVDRGRTMSKRALDDTKKSVSFNPLKDPQAPATTTTDVVVSVNEPEEEKK
jgi:hypothetical protein